MKFLPGLRKKPKPIDSEILAQELSKRLSDYYSKEEVKEYLEKVRSDERKRSVWESLSMLNKVKLLRFIVKKKGENGGKRKTQNK